MPPTDVMTWWRHSFWPFGFWFGSWISTTISWTYFELPWCGSVMRVTSVQTITFFFQNANQPCVRWCGSDEMAAQRFSNPQKASSYFVCRRVFEKGNEKGMCIRMCDVSPFYGCLCSISSGLNEKCYALSLAIRPLPSRLGTWARWQLHHGEAEQRERAFPIWKRRSFHFG